MTRFLALLAVDEKAVESGAVAADVAFAFVAVAAEEVMNTSERVR
jgi:hypothetical protein